MWVRGGGPRKKGVWREIEKRRESELGIGSKSAQMPTVVVYQIKKVELGQRSKSSSSKTLL